MIQKKINRICFFILVVSLALSLDTILPINPKLIQGNLPLLNEEIINGRIISEQFYPELNIYEFQLSNGANIFFKNTNFKEDQII